MRFGRPLWMAEISWRIRPGDVSALRYLLDGLSGQHASVMLRDMSVRQPAFRGTVTAQSLAAVGATSVATTGWTPSTAVMAAGDYVQLGRRLYLAASAVTSNGSGVATIALDRPLLEAVAAGAEVNYRLPACEMRMIDDAWTGARDAEDGLMSVRATFLETVENVA